MLREKQMSVSRELEEKQTTCQQLQTSADELEVQIDTLSEERQRVSFQHLNYNSYPVVKDCVISWSSSFAMNLSGGRREKVFSTFPAHFLLPSTQPSLRKQPTLHDATTGPPPPRNDIWELSAEIPYWWRITTQIWLVTRHQYGISALNSQMSLRGETRGGVVKCRLFSQATPASLWHKEASAEKRPTFEKVTTILRLLCCGRYDCALVEWTQTHSLLS